MNQTARSDTKEISKIRIIAVRNSDLVISFHDGDTDMSSVIFNTEYFAEYFYLPSKFCKIQGKIIYIEASYHFYLYFSKGGFLSEYE